MCFWRNNVNFNFEWTLRGYSHPNGLTGPKADHTSGTLQNKGLTGLTSIEFVSWHGRTDIGRPIGHWLLAVC